MLKNNVKTVTIIVVALIVASMFYFFFLREYLDRSTDFTPDMIRRIIIRYRDGKLIVIKSGDQRLYEVLDRFNRLLDDVGSRLRRIYTDESIVDILNNSTYIEVFLNNRYVFKLAGEKVEASKIIVFIEGAEKGVVVIDRGLVLNIYLWLCWRIDVSKNSFQELYMLISTYR